MQTKSPSKSVFWPAEVLPDDHSDVRILTFGYDSNIINLGGPVDKNNISQHGRALLSAVLNDRRQQESLARPLIFVAHSLGGLLVKEALIESRKQGKHKPERDLSKICPSIIFLGTPHRGSSDASWAQILSNIAGAVQIDTNNSILRALDPSSGSSKLEDLRRDFSDILDEGQINIYSFQESAGKTRLKLAGGKLCFFAVVPDESSSFDSRKFETVDYINANHVNMCRFWGRDDDGYEKFAGALAESLDAIKQNFRKAEAEKLEAKQAEEAQHLLNRLDYTERTVREAQVERTNYQATSMTWLWDLPEGRNPFEQWLLNNEALFWISGKPASGKSTLMAHISRDDKVLEFLRSTTERSWVVIRFFFDFRAGKNISNSMEGLLRSLLLQLLQEIPDLTPLAPQSGRVRCGSDEILSWNQRDLREMLNWTFTESPQNICLLIDGLDEYDGDMIELLDFFHELAAGGFDKICLASRPEPVISQNLSTCPGFRMEHVNFQGIARYVSTTLRRSVPSSSETERLKSISDDIARRAERIFLWARFAIRELIEGFSEGDDLEELGDRLAQLPPDLEQLYDRIFDRMTPEDRKVASVMFRL
ncbi:MAG: hypothetical protein M1835_002606, partial [Candelina submexicana]